MKRYASVFGLLLITVITLHAEPEIKGTASELAAHLAAMPRLVALSGEAEIKVPADRAVVAVRVVTEHRSLQEASRANQELRVRMLRQLGERGIPAERVQAAKFSSTPKYGMFGERPKSYRIENVVKVTTQDEKEYQAVANLVDNTSELRYDSIEFEHSNKEQMKEKALTLAIDKAVEKKRFYEGKLGVKLTPKSFSEQRIVPIPVMAGRRMYAKMTESAVGYVAPLGTRSTEPVGGEEAELPTAFDEIIFKAMVTVEYAVESK